MIKKNSEFDIVTIVIFLVIICLPFIASVSGIGSQYKKTEMRLLAKIPKAPSNIKEWQAYPHAFSDYIDDNFGLRQELLLLESRIKWMLRLQLTPKVILGRDGWLFLGKYENINMIEQYRGIDHFEEIGLQNWIKSADQIKKWLEKRGIHFIIVIPPDKHSIYPEYLPDHIGSIIGERRIDQLARGIQEQSDIDFIDLRQPLLEAKKHHQVFFKLDTHWNEIGGFIGYGEIMKHVNKYYPRVQPIAFTDYTLQTQQRINGDLAKLMNLESVMSENEDKMIPKFPSRIMSYENIGSVQNEIELKVSVSTNRPNLPSLLIFNDSFIWAMAKPLFESFNRTFLVHHQGFKFDKSQVENQKPDIVLYELVERGASKAIIDNSPLCWSAQTLSASAKKLAVEDISFGGVYKLHALEINRVEQGIRIDVWWEELRHEEVNNQRYLFFHLVDKSGKIIYNQRIALFPYKPLDAEKRWRHGAVEFNDALSGVNLMSLAFGIYDPSGQFLLSDKKMPTDWEGRRLLVPLSAISGTVRK